jgi:hypothetical protein
MYRLLLADAREKRLAINRNSCPPCQPVPPVYPFNEPIVEIVVYKGEDTGKTCEAGTCSKVKSGGIADHARNKQGSWKFTENLYCRYGDG